MHAPLDIPEIMSQIASSISTSDFTSCLRVSKIWYQVFISLLWKEIHLAKHNYVQYIPAEASLNKHTYLITALSFSGNVPPYLIRTVFPNLTKLSFSATYGGSYDWLPLMLSNNPTIEDLSMQFASRDPSHIVFCEKLSKLPRLKRLQIQSFLITPETVGAFWKTLCRLERAELFLVTFPDSVFNQSTTPHKLKSLSMSYMGNPQQYLKFIEKFTKLEYLNLCDADFDCKILVDSFARRTWPHLHKIDFPCFKFNHIDLQLILCSVTRLTALSVDYAAWGHKSFLALSQHFRTLEILKSKEPSFTSVMVNTVMSSCPNLKELTAIVIKGVDIINNNQVDINGQHSLGWRCHKLTMLEIRFNLNGVKSQVPILERIAKLKQLSRLNMRNNSPERYPTISLSLNNGLDMLKPLRNLSYLHLGRNYNNSMTEADLDWIFKNWRNLRNLHGQLHHDSDLGYALQEILKLHEIESW